jgi:Fe-S-cluster containining protein
MPPRSPPWKTSPARAELRAIYARVDARLEGYSCDASTECCRFGVTGREPYVTPVELAEVEHAIAARGFPTPAKRSPRSLPLAGDERPCPLLEDTGRCRIYESRPLGCRTFFCDRAHGDMKRFPREELNRAVRDVADLAARYAPRDPGGRPFTRALKR